MGSLSSPKTWVPYTNTKDCSQGFCSLYCPQWCYIIFPPPPPLVFPNDNSGPNFSPLVIAIIGILASAFLLVSYYAIISKYCGNMDSSRRRESQPHSHEEVEDNHDPSQHEPWLMTTAGLDEALIESIAVCKYKKGDGLVDSTDCSVCLGEFQDDETLRLLPKCSHAFHVNCIDTWLKSHSSCPLCRANIVLMHPQPIQSPQQATDHPQNPTITLENPQENDEISLGVLEMEASAREEGIQLIEDRTKNPIQAFGEGSTSDTVIEISDEGGHGIRRSVSLDHSRERRVSIADILELSQEEDCQMNECQLHGSVGSSKGALGEASKCDSSSRSRVLECVMSSVGMRRSLSSGRFFSTRNVRGLNAVIPV
ncbi:hypothetical protein Ancab_015750 [Ancistrocladus abbreviatus]